MLSWLKKQVRNYCHLQLFVGTIYVIYVMSHVKRGSVFSVLTGNYINRAVLPQKRASSLKFRIEEEERLNYLCCENKGADQLQKNRFSHEAALIM